MNTRFRHLVVAFAVVAFVGGVVRECWYDNLATAVAERRGKLVRFHPRFLAYAGHHRFRPVACNVGRGNEKGRVEDAIKYLRTNFWPGRTFRDLADLNAQAQENQGSEEEKSVVHE